LWSETQNVQVSLGIYSVALGSSNAFPNTLTFADECYLGVQVGGGDYLTIGDDLIPLTTTWTAFRSQTSAGRIIKTVSGNYPVTQSDDIIYASGSITITLPSASGCSGKIFTIENVGTETVSIQTNGVQTFDDDTSMTLDSKYAQVTLVSNGSGWYRLGASGGVSLTEDNTMTGTLTVDNTTASTSASSGALVVSGGVGISEKLYVGDNISTSGDVSGAAATFSGALNAASVTTSGNVSASAGTFSGQISVDDTTGSTSTSSGALVVDGGVGISEKLYVGDDISTSGDVSGAAATFSGALNAASVTTAGDVSASAGTFSGQISVDDTTGSTSTSSGALVVDGGVGIAEKLYVGNDISTTGNVSAETATLTAAVSIKALYVDLMTAR